MSWGCLYDRTKDKVIQILNSFNEQHDRLKFIIEYEEDHCLNFLNLRSSIKIILLF